MSQWVHNEKDLNMSKYFRCFTDNVHSWAGRLKARGVAGSLLISLVGERFEPREADSRRRQQTRVSNLAAMQQHLAKSQVKDGIEIFAFE